MIAAKTLGTLFSISHLNILSLNYKARSLLITRLLFMYKKKIGIVLPCQNGDLITGTSVLKYRNILWPDCDIVWFCNEPHSDALKHQDIEIRYFPHGWGILENDVNGIYRDRVLKDKLEGRPEWEDWSVLMNEQNRLNPEFKDKFKSISDLHEAYFPAPWMLDPIRRHGLSYPEVSKKVFGVPSEWEWHPMLEFSEDDYDMVEAFLNNIGMYKKVLIETFAGSGQSLLDSEMITHAMFLCKEHWPNCEFIFASHKYLRGDEQFPEWLLSQDNVHSAAKFTVRQCALIAGSCDIILSVSSGITVAASCWFNRPVPILAFAGSEICGTRAIALGEYQLVTADERSLDAAKKEYYEKLVSLLKKYK